MEGRRGHEPELDEKIRVAERAVRPRELLPRKDGPVGEPPRAAAAKLHPDGRAGALGGGGAGAGGVAPLCPQRRDAPEGSAAVVHHVHHGDEALAEDGLARLGFADLEAEGAGADVGERPGEALARRRRGGEERCGRGGGVEVRLDRLGSGRAGEKSKGPATSVRKCLAR